MRAQSAAPVSGITGGGRINSGNARSITPVRLHHGIGGFFWLQSPSWQANRIRELARTFSAETISTITGRSFRDVVTIIEGAQ